MATRAVKKIKDEINKLENEITDLESRLKKIQSKCKHNGKREKNGTNLESCTRCNKVFTIPPTTSIFPPSAFIR